MAGNQLPMPGGDQRDQTKFIVFENFEKMNTQSIRQSLSEKDLYWDENLQPIAPNNYRTVPGPAQNELTNIEITKTISVMYYAALNGVDYIVVFTTSGAGYLITISNGNVNPFAPDGTYSPYPDVTTWQASRLLIADPKAGYGTFDGGILVTQGGVSPNITVTNGGSGYGTPPTVTITGGSGTGAAAHAVLTNGSVTSIVLDNPGHGYQVGDVLTVNISGSAGSGAAGHVTTTGFPVAGLSIAFLGSFSSPGVGNHQLSFTGGGGGGARGFATCTGVGFGISVTGVTLTSTGSGYTSPPTCTLSTNGSVPVFNTFLGTQSVATIVLDAGGTGYGGAPAVSIVPSDGTGSGATAVATISGTAVNTLTLTASPVSGLLIAYQGVSTSPPGTYALSFSGGGGTLAAGTATIGNYTNDLGTTSVGVTGLTITVPGSGYTTSPAVTVGGGATFSQAPTLSALIASQGAGYDLTPSVFIGAGTGATATAHVWPFINSNIVGDAFTTLAVFQGRVWLGGGNILTWTGTGASYGNVGYDDFLAADASGSLIISDADLIHVITALRAYNNYLFIMGDQSVKQIGNISLNQAGDVTLFTILTLSSDQGTIYQKSCISYNRVFMFANSNGVYGVFGSSVQKLSNDMDGIWRLVDFSLLPQGALVDINGIHNAVFLIKYNDPLSAPRNILIVFDSKKWFVISAASEVAIATTASLPTGRISLYSSTGFDITQSLADPTVAVSFKVQSSLSHHGNAVQRKKLVRAGIAVTQTQSQAGSVVVVNGGTGGTPGSAVLTVVGGVGRAATMTGTISGGGVLTAAVLGNGGSYIVQPSNPASVSGGGLVGATVNLAYSFGSVTLSMDTENISNSYAFVLSSGFQVPALSVEGSGRYLGQTLTGNLAGFTFTNLALEYQEISLWS